MVAYLDMVDNHYVKSRDPEPERSAVAVLMPRSEYDELISERDRLQQSLKDATFRYRLAEAELKDLKLTMEWERRKSTQQGACPSR